jgi:hypothetical protein
VTWAGSLVITAAAINTTHKMTPTALRNIKATRTYLKIAGRSRSAVSHS